MLVVCVSGSSRWCRAIRPQITINQHKSLESLQLVFQSNQTVASITKSITDETNQLASTTPETNYHSHTPLIHLWTYNNTNAETSSDVHHDAITKTAMHISKYTARTKLLHPTHSLIQRPRYTDSSSISKNNTRLLSS